MKIVEIAAESVTGAILDNPVALLAIGAAAIGYGVYCAGYALAELAKPVVDQVADIVSDTFEAATNEVGSWFSPATADAPATVQNIRHIPIRVCD